MLLPTLLLSALHMASAPARAADSLTGTWQISGDVVGNPVNERCTLKQAGTVITGSCKNTDAADAKSYDVTGEVRDGKVTLRHGGEYEGQALTLTYSGTFPGAAAPSREFKGSIDVQPFGVNGTFTAAPAPAAPPAPTKP